MLMNAERIVIIAAFWKYVRTKLVVFIVIANLNTREILLLVTVKVGTVMCTV